MKAENSRAVGIRTFLLLIFSIILLTIGLYFQSHIGRYDISYLSPNKLCSMYENVRPESIRSSGCPHHFSTSDLLFEEYMNFLLKHGEVVDSERIFTGGGSEYWFAAIRDKRGGGVLYVGKLSGPDEGKCDYMVRNEEKFICSASFFHKVADDIGAISESKWLVQVFKWL